MLKKNSLPQLTKPGPLFRVGKMIFATVTSYICARRSCRLRSAYCRPRTKDEAIATQSREVLEALSNANAIFPWVQLGRFTTCIA